MCGLMLRLSNLQFMVLLSVVTLAMAAMAAFASDRNAMLFAASVFSLAAIVTGYRLNRPYWRAPAAAVASPARLLFATTMIMAGVYAWASVALILIYPVAGLVWQNGWVYGCGAALIALCLGLFARTVGGSRADLPPATLDAAVKLAAVHGVIIACGVAGLVGGGKLHSLKQDWAATYVFLAGGFAIICLTMFAIRTHAALTN